MKNIHLGVFISELRMVLTASVGSDYAYYLAHDEGFASDVKQNVEETSAWSDDGVYNDDDIKLAVGRVLLERLGIEYL